MRETPLSRVCPERVKLMTDHRVALVVALQGVLNLVALLGLAKLWRNYGMLQRWSSLQADRLYVLRRRLAEPPYGLEYVQSGHIEAHLPPSVWMQEEK